MNCLQHPSFNLLHHLSLLDPDEAGGDPSEVSARYGNPLQEILVLSPNENPHSPSPVRMSALNGTALSRYPDSRAFMAALSEYTGNPAEKIIIGAGMDEIILTFARLFWGQEIAP